MNNMMNEQKVISDKTKLFALSESKIHYLQVEPNSDEHLKVWVKQPTWLQIEKAMTTVMKIDQKSQSFDLDLNGMYKYMAENFIEKTEPSLSAVDLIRLTPYIGNQLKEILPNPMDYMSGDDSKNEE